MPLVLGGAEQICCVCRCLVSIPPRSSRSATGILRALPALALAAAERFAREALAAIRDHIAARAVNDTSNQACRLAIRGHFRLSSSGEFAGQDTRSTPSCFHTNAMPPRFRSAHFVCRERWTGKVGDALMSRDEAHSCTITASTPHSAHTASRTCNDG